MVDVIQLLVYSYDIICNSILIKKKLFKNIRFVQDVWYLKHAIEIPTKHLTHHHLLDNSGYLLD